MAIPPSIEIFPDKEAVARAAAAAFTARAVAAVAARGAFTVALSGGSTPKDLFRLLVAPDEPFRARLPWRKLHLFWGDERHVPPDHPDSNYRMTREELLDHAPEPPASVHRIAAENSDAAAVAALYEAELRAFFPVPPGGFPRFDLVLLGMGPEGHTASLFPASPVLAEEVRWVAAPWVEKLHSFRITLTPPVINHAAAVYFLVTGEEKAPALHAVLEGDVLAGGADQYPARIVRPVDGELCWLIDRAAAKDLSTGV